MKEFPIEPHIAKARNIKREHSIPPSAIDRQYQQWREYKGMPTYKGNKALPDAIIVDVDGTIAHMNRHPFEWSKVSTDTPRANIVALVNMLPYKIIIMSGRDGCCYDDTKAWLEKHNVKHDLLLMRKAGDSRPDALIKEELFWQEIAHSYNVLYSIDDRDRMVARWRALGLECIQVQAGDF